MNSERLKIFNSMHPGGQSYDYQEKWSSDTSRYKIGIKARQIGITTTEAITSFIDAILWEESDETPNPPVVIFCSPSQRQSARLMHYLQRARTVFEKYYNTVLTFKKEREDHLYFANGAEIFSLPNNPRTIEGIAASKAVIDEIGNFEGRDDELVYEALMGSLAANKGSMIVFGKPRGRRGLFWKLADPFGDYVGKFSKHIFDWNARARLDPDYKQTVIDQRLRMSHLAFIEQYECEFIDEGIVMFPWGLLDRQTNKANKIWNPNMKVSTLNPVYMGIDFGKRVNKTAVTVVEHSDNTILRYLGTSQDSYDKQIPWISSLIDWCKPVKCLVDMTTLGIPLTDFLTKRFASVIEGVTFTKTVKEKLVMTTKNLFESNQIQIPDIKSIKDQLHGIEKEVTEQGSIKYTGKRSETDWQDDEAWSLFLACSQLGEGNFELTIATNRQMEQIGEYEQWSKDLDEYGDPL